MIKYFCMLSKFLCLFRIKLYFLNYKINHIFSKYAVFCRFFSRLNAVLMRLADFAFVIM